MLSRTFYPCDKVNGLAESSFYDTFLWPTEALQDIGRQRITALLPIDALVPELPVGIDISRSEAVRQ